MFLGTEQEASVPWVKGGPSPAEEEDFGVDPRAGEKAAGGKRARSRASGGQHHDSKLRGGKPGGVQRIPGVRRSC